MASSLPKGAAEVEHWAGHEPAVGLWPACAWRLTLVLEAASETFRDCLPGEAGHTSACKNATPPAPIDMSDNP